MEKPMPDPARNKEIVLEWFRRFGQDIELLAGHITDDFVWHMPRSAEMNFPDVTRRLHGMDGLRELKALAAQVFDFASERSVTTNFVVSEGDIVVIQNMQRMKTAKGAPYENDYCFCVRVAGGKVAEVWEFTDTLAATRMFDMAT